ncbi:MAG: FMN-binding protein [Candidatus Moranbacteria bacterium]|nr:FMN-binding protein [Candidatus Moranbacteria bacterium]
MKIKNSVAVALAVVIVGSVFVYYRYAKDTLQTMKPKETVAPMAATKEVSAVITYGEPGKYSDTLRFVVTVDGAGAIQEIKTLEDATGEVPEKRKEFNELVNVQLKGKKLADISALDKVGKSTMTTKAFNDALVTLKAGL